MAHDLLSSLRANRQCDQNSKFGSNRHVTFVKGEEAS